MKKKITLIAEIGENYLGSISFAKKLIDEAKKSGADYAKFQSYNELCLKRSDPEYNWFKKVSLTDKNHLMLKKHCKKKKYNCCMFNRTGNIRKSKKKIIKKISIN